jgi:hypothetical protein
VDGQSYVEVRGSSTFEQSSTLFHHSNLITQTSACFDILTCLPCSLGSYAPLLHLVVDAGMLSPGCGPLATTNMTASRILYSSSCGKLHRLTTETSSFLVYPRRFSRRSEDQLPSPRASSPDRSSTAATCLAREGSLGCKPAPPSSLSNRRPIIESLIEKLVRKRPGNPMDMQST